jgi:hypothetical protein
MGAQAGMSMGSDCCYEHESAYWTCYNPPAVETANVCAIEQQLHRRQCPRLALF